MALALADVSQRVVANLLDARAGDNIDAVLLQVVRQQQLPADVLEEGGIADGIGFLQ